MAPIILAEDLRKAYRIREQEPGLRSGIVSLFRPTYVTRHALGGISFSVEPGARVGLIGANGAGKSTLVKLLVGIMRCDSGHLMVNGRDPFENRKDYVQRIGVVFGQRSNLLWDLSVEDSFELHAAIFGVPPDEYCRRLVELTEIFELSKILHQPARTLSLGQTMRCAVAQVLLQQPDILFLDEPTIGLDVVSVERLGMTLKRLNETLKTTIVVTSHDLSVIEGVCTQVLLLEEGSLLFDGTAQAAIDKYGRYRKFRFIFPPNADLDAAAALLKQTGMVVSRDAMELAGVADAGGDTIVACAKLVEELTRDYKLLEFFVEKPSLKEVILHAFQ